MPNAGASTSRVPPSLSPFSGHEAADVGASRPAPSSPEVTTHLTQMRQVTHLRHLRDPAPRSRPPARPDSLLHSTPTPTAPVQKRRGACQQATKKARIPPNVVRSRRCARCVSKGWSSNTCTYLERVMFFRDFYRGRREEGGLFGPSYPGSGSLLWDDHEGVRGCEKCCGLPARRARWLLEEPSAGSGVRDRISYLVTRIKSGLAATEKCAKKVASTR